MKTEYLVRRAQRGDKDAFVELMRLSEARMYRLARSILRQNPADVEDAIQDTVVKAFTLLSDLRSPKSFNAWITRILINNCINQIRAHEGLLPLKVFAEDDPASDPREIEKIDLTLDMQRMLSLLRDNDQLAMTLYYLNDMPVRDIARILSVSEAAVKQRLHNSRKRMKKILDDHGYSDKF